MSRSIFYIISNIFSKKTIILALHKRVVVLRMCTRSLLLYARYCAIMVWCGVVSERGNRSPEEGKD